MGKGIESVDSCRCAGPWRGDARVANPAAANICRSRSLVKRLTSDTLAFRSREDRRRHLHIVELEQKRKRYISRAELLFEDIVRRCLLATEKTTLLASDERVDAEVAGQPNADRRHAGGGGAQRTDKGLGAATADPQGDLGRGAVEILGECGLRPGALKMADQ